MTPTSSRLLALLSLLQARRDWPGQTLAERLEVIERQAGRKIPDIFAGHGLTESEHSESNDHGVDLTLEHLRRAAPAFIFTNLVDFDSKYGHRNDPPGYAARIEVAGSTCEQDTAARGVAPRYQQDRINAGHVTADRRGRVGAPNQAADAPPDLTPFP